MCNATESNRAEIGPSELATKCRGKSKKEVSVYPITLDKAALGLVLYGVRYYMAVTAHMALCIVGCCMRVAATYTVLHVVGYYALVTICAASHIMLGMLSQLGCCI